MLHALLTLALGAASVTHSANGWQEVLDRVAPSVAVIRVSAPRAFDVNATGYMTATGFVVDAERGILLTNRPLKKKADRLKNLAASILAEYGIEDFPPRPSHDGARAENGGS